MKCCATLCSDILPWLMDPVCSFVSSDFLVVYIFINVGLFFFVEEMGTEILDDLHSQRNTIQRARDRV